MVVIANENFIPFFLPPTEFSLSLFSFSLLLLINLQGELPSFQEQYMEVVNPFILKNKERMIVFLDQLSNVADPFPVAVDYTIINSNANNNSDTGRLLSL